MQYFIQIPHIIFCCPLSAYDKWWFEQKKSPHFLEKCFVLSYLKFRRKWKKRLKNIILSYRRENFRIESSKNGIFFTKFSHPVGFSQNCQSTETLDSRTYASVVAKNANPILNISSLSSPKVARSQQGLSDAMMLNCQETGSCMSETEHRNSSLSALGCVYTYPDIRISGYPDVKDPDIFGAFTRIGSKRFRRLHVSRYPDALYAAYSLCVGEIRKCFFFGQVACLQTLFHFFLSFCCLLAGRQGQNFVW